MSDDDLFYVRGIWYYLCFVIPIMRLIRLR